VFVLVLVAAHVVAVVSAEDDYGYWLNPAEAPLAGRLGLAAVALLVVLAIMALWRRPLRIGYEVWRGLHIAFGIGVVALAFGHVLAVGRFSDTGTIRWLTLGFVVLALVAAFYLRVARQFASSRRPYRLQRAIDEPDGSISLELEAVDHPGVAFLPGQFAWLKRADSPYALSEHPFSFASSALSPERPSFTVKPAGDHTARLKELEAGDRLLIDGPHGSPAFVDGREGVLISAGSGITPAISTLRTAAAEGDERRLVLLYFVRDPERHAFRDELRELATQPNVEVVVIPSRPPADWHGPSGRVGPELLDQLLPPDRDRWSYLVCGPPAMADVTERALLDLGISRAGIRVERYKLA
jgi:predicted ferric reductase